MAKKVGIDCEFYYAAGASAPDVEAAGDGTWTAAGCVQDVSKSDAFDSVSFDCRETGFRRFKTTIRESGIEVSMYRDYEDAAYLAFYNAFKAKSVIGIAMLEGAVGGATDPAGFVMDAIITDMPEDESLGSGATVSMTFKPHIDSDFEPDFYAAVNATTP